jgi:hypothetical protein
MTTTGPADPATPTTKTGAKLNKQQNKATKQKFRKGDDLLPAYRRASLPEEAGPIDRLAFEILSARSDLLPSVERIISGSGGDDGTTERALELFRASLTTVGDPNRDPRVAIVNASPTPGSRARSGGGTSND